MTDKNGSDDGKVVDIKKAGKAKALRITAKGERFRRAGMSFGREPTEIKLADLDKTTVADLMAEPRLVVEEIEH